MVGAIQSAQPALYRFLSWQVLKGLCSDSGCVQHLLPEQGQVCSAHLWVKHSEAPGPIGLRKTVP